MLLLTSMLLKVCTPPCSLLLITLACDGDSRVIVGYTVNDNLSYKLQFPIINNNITVYSPAAGKLTIDMGKYISSPTSIPLASTV